LKRNCGLKHWKTPNYFIYEAYKDNKEAIL